MSHRLCLAEVTGCDHADRPRTVALGCPSSKLHTALSGLPFASLVLMSSEVQEAGLGQQQKAVEVLPGYCPGEARVLWSHRLGRLLQHDLRILLP